MCVYVRKIQFRLYHYHENGLILIEYSKNITHINAPIEYFLGFDLIDKKMTMVETNDRKS